MTTEIAGVAKAIRDGLPVLRAGNAIRRELATDQTWFADFAPYFAKIDDHSINRLTRYAKRKAPEKAAVRMARKYRPILGLCQKASRGLEYRARRRHC
jgi:hypothetical protein